MPVTARAWALESGGCISFLRWEGNTLVIAVITHQHLEHVHHAALLAVGDLPQDLLKRGGDSQVQGLAFSVGKSHRVPRKCLCSCGSVQNHST